jgi:hypothetical protein
VEKGFWIVVAVLGLGAVLLLLQPEMQDTFAPEPVAAWVGIETLGAGAQAGTVVVGPVEIPVGLEDSPRFRLHAVVGAKSRSGEMVYYTEAKKLLLGGEEITGDRLLTWDRARTVKLRWYSVEGRWPFLLLDAESGIRGLQMQEFLRSDWPLAWSVPGEIDAVNDDHLEADRRGGRQNFGTQRYQVRFQLYTRPDDLVPSLHIKSWGADELKEHVDEFPTVTAVLPGHLGPASRVFGLTQLEPDESVPKDQLAEMQSQIDELAEHQVVFSRLTVLRDQVRASGRLFEDLTWDLLELDGSVAWGTADDRSIAAGDLLRVGSRIVVLFDDRGTPGVVDYDDLCFDFVQGSEVRSLGDIFGPETLGTETPQPADNNADVLVVEHASL